MCKILGILYNSNNLIIDNNIGSIPWPIYQMHGLKFWDIIG